MSRAKRCSRHSQRQTLSACRIPAQMVHRMSLWRCQNPWSEPGGYPVADRRKAEPATGHRCPRRRLDQQDRFIAYWQGKAEAQNPWSLRQVLVPDRLRRNQKTPAKQPKCRHQTMVMHAKTTGSRVVCPGSAPPASTELPYALTEVFRTSAHRQILACHHDGPVDIRFSSPRDIGQDFTICGV